MSAIRWFWLSSAAAVVLVGLLGLLAPAALWLYVPLGALILLGAWDIVQRPHNVLRNFPVVGHFRYVFEAIRPEIQQYFVESDTDGRPFSRELRSVVYQRAKEEIDTRPFGTIRDLYAVGAEWIAHSITPLAHAGDIPRIEIGAGRCERPYSAALLNVSAMSFGSLSRNAVLALNHGAKLGGFFHNTGEGGITPYHLQHGGDLVWQVGTGYFGCRTPEGLFDEDRFAERAGLEPVRMIEVKISQGAKPGHGGILPAGKVTAEIAAIRGVPMGRDVVSPPYHTAFRTPVELIEWVGRLRELSGGKPVGIKLCVGRPKEFMGICKAMLETGQRVDFITVDGAEGGTGAAPLEFSNSVGLPLTEGLLLVHNTLVGCNLRDEVKVLASGKIVTGFNLIQRVAIGADLCSSARAMMMALGCIQALRCNTNNCPVGVATQDPALARGLDPELKAVRVRNFQRNTVESAMELIGAAGLTHPGELRPTHIYRRTGPTRIETYEDVYDYLEPGDLVAARIHGGGYHQFLADQWLRARANRF